VPRDSVAVSALSGGNFAVSDLVVGRVGSGLVWSDRGDTVFLNPLDRFAPGAAAELYYEVYGVPPGAEYHTVVRLERQGGRSWLGAIGRLLGGDGRAPGVFGFDAPRDGLVTRVHPRLELRDVPPGEYVLRVRIGDPAARGTVARH